MNPTGDVTAAVTPVVETLEALDVSYRIGGSVATSAYGTPRATLDVDMVCDLGLSAVQLFVTALEDRYYVDADMVRDAIRRRASFNVIHLETMLKVDIFVLKRRSFDQQAFRRGLEDTLAEVEGARRFMLSTPEDMILHKLEWFRLGGEISERQWHDVLGVLKVQSSSLDRFYLDHWAGQLGLEDLLHRAMVDAGLIDL